MLNKVARWKMLPSPPAPDAGPLQCRCWGPAQCLGSCGLCPGWGLQLLLSLLLVQLITNSEHSPETCRQRQDIDTAGHTGCPGQKAAFNCTYTQDSDRIQPTKSHFYSLVHEDRSTLMQAYKQHCPGSQGHMHSLILLVMPQLPHLPRTMA